MSTREIKRYCSVNDDAEKPLETAINKLGLSVLAYCRVLNVGGTTADLVGATNIEASHIGEAVQYRGLDRRMRIRPFSGQQPLLPNVLARADMLRRMHRTSSTRVGMYPG
jgi:hypothetical protein